nr:class I SAM-dependent methyltransferase [Herbihabitans rhizosphaerae]
MTSGQCWLELSTGERLVLPTSRWKAASDAADAWMLDACTGPTLDVGCGPGRLTAALTARGVPALGVDSSPVAVRLARERGAVALCRDVFDRLPGEGRWRHVLLADGNVGIGGDPVRLLRRTGELLRRGGTALVEVSGPGEGLRTGRVRVASATLDGAWFDWAWLGVDALEGCAHDVGLRLGDVGRRGERWFAELIR